MEDMALLGQVMIIIGILLAIFYATYVKRREAGAGVDTAEKRIALYTAFGIAAIFVGGGTILLLATS